MKWKKWATEGFVVGGGQGQGNALTQLSYPYGLFVDTLVNTPVNGKWKQNGVTIAGGHGQGNATNELNEPYGLFVDDDQRVVIAD
ncbi:unnamed protein product [Rotaria magnacalcarata]